MTAAVDNTFLTLLLNPKAAPRPNPATGLPVPHCRERTEALIDELSKRSRKLVIPAPALAESLCGSEAAEAYLRELQQHRHIEVANFDTRAAVEFGRIIRDAKANNDKRSGQIGNWEQVKMDRLIVAIALSRGADTLYSDDTRQGNFAKMVGLSVISTWELDLPPEYAQQSLFDVAK